MRMAELSHRTAVPVPTIKYYQREGLLPTGERTSPNQVRYDERHVRRVKLVRALIEVAGLSIADIRALIATMDAPQAGLHKVFGAAQRALSNPRERADGQAPVAAQREVEEFIARRGWRVKRDNPSIGTAATVLATWRDLAQHGLAQRDLGAILDDYADAVEQIAAVDLTAVNSQGSAEDMVQVVMIGTLLGDVLLTALRRLAHEDASARLFGTTTPVGASDDRATASP
ncbi:MAG: MerR family transcriptional regulator [Pseudonocardiaceae bacterium]